MKVQIFDVEHGACALVTGTSGERILVDCGHNNTTGFRPSNYLFSNYLYPLHLLINTNYDQDHMSDFPNIQKYVGFETLARNTSVSPAVLERYKSESGGVSHAMETFIESISTMTPVPTSPALANFRITYFRNAFPAITEINDLSLVTFIEADGISIVLPGDVSAKGWKALLLDEQFRTCLARVNIFVASHHGREDGYCSEVFDYCRNIEVVIVSDKPIEHDTQRGINYSQHARGHIIAGQTYKTLTTRCHGDITIQSGTLLGGFSIQTEKGIPAQPSPIALALSAFERGSAMQPPPAIPNASILAGPPHDSLLSSWLKPKPTPIPSAGLINSGLSSLQPPKTILGGMIEQALRDEKKRRGGGNV